MSDDESDDESDDVSVAWAASLMAAWFGGRPSSSARPSSNANHQQGLQPRLAPVVPFTICTSTQVKVALNGVQHVHHLLDVQVFATWIWMAHELSPSLSATHLGRAGASEVRLD